jgi:hypothetical protein
VKLPIADCRLPIEESLSCRSFARGCHDGCEFVRFGQKRGKFSHGHDAGLDKQFQPECGFIGFFLNCADFGDKFRLAAGATTGTIVCGHRSSASDDLLGNDASGIVIFWNSACQLDDSQRKGFRARLQFSWSHDGAKLQTQSAIGNQQSSMLL